MTSVAAPAPLVRDALARAGALRPAAPVRIVHVGLGAFHRAHQAWYTARASDADRWGIAAYTGRRPDAAAALSPQGGVYTLVERGGVGDSFELVDSIVKVRSGDDIADFVATVRDPDVAVLTLTITEAGYRLDAGGGPDLSDPVVVADLTALAAAVATEELQVVALGSSLARVVLALEARRRAGAPPLAVVPCDNLPANGALARAALYAWADRVSPALAAWMPEGVSFVSTSVDRITPRTTAADVAEVAAATGRLDAAPVVTEPFSDWVLSGSFPSGRPDWESAGARFVDDVEPWEERKLWLLNGAHTLLAALGLVRGHTTVAEAVADERCRSAMERFWSEASAHLHDLDLDRYLASLRARFGNARIEHRLAQISQDAQTKLRVRIAPVARRERALGRSGAASALALAAWIVSERRQSPGGEGVRREVHAIDAELGVDDAFVATVALAVDELVAATALESVPGSPGSRPDNGSQRFLAID